jgi:uncharacterized protein YqeY
MSIKEKLKSAVKDAMRAKDKLALETIRSLLSAIQYEEMAAKTEDLTDDKVMAVIQAELKKQKESLEYAEKDARTEMISEINSRISCINSFLPEQLSKEKLDEIIKQFINENNTTEIGKIMSYLKSAYAGQYDSKIASELAKQTN